MHIYYSDDSDNFICDDCDTQIMGDVYSSRGRVFKSRKVARVSDTHYCEDCASQRFPIEEMPEQ